MESKLSRGVLKHPGRDRMRDFPWEHLPSHRRGLGNATGLVRQPCPHLSLWPWDLDGALGLARDSCLRERHQVSPKAS